MACSIIFKVKGGKEFSIQTNLTSDQVSLDGILGELLNIPASQFTAVKGKSYIENVEDNIFSVLGDLLDYNETDVQKATSVTKEFEDVIEDDSRQIVGNCDFATLKQRFPSVFKDIDESDLELRENEEILLVSRLSYKGVGLGDKLIIPSTGQAVYIVNNIYSARKLAQYIKIRKAIKELTKETESSVFKDISPLTRKALDYVKSKSKIKSDKNALLYFLENSSQFFYTLSDGLDVYTQLTNLIKLRILNGPIRKQLEDPDANAILSRSQYNFDDHTYNISISQAKKVITELGKEKEMLNYIGDDPKKQAENLATYVQNILSKGDLSVQIKADKGVLKFKTPFTTFQDLGITYEAMPLLRNGFSRHGYNVFKGGEQEFYISPSKFLTPNMRATKVESETKAKAYIDGLLARTPLKNYMKLPLLSLLSMKGVQDSLVIDNYFPSEDTVLQIINYPIEAKYWKDIIDEKYLKYLGYSYTQFMDALIDDFKLSEEQLNIIDTGDKAIVFLIEASKAKRLNTKTLEKILNTINDLDYQYFHITDVKSKTENQSQVVFTKLSNIQETDQKYNNKKDQISKAVPMIVVLNNIADVMNSQPGVKGGKPVIEIITDYDLRKNEKFLQVSRRAKAFILDGTIYVNASRANSSDLYHEYAHLFLGMIKASNVQQYTRFMQTLSDSYAQINNMKQKLRTEEEYANLADADLTEEAFAHLFGEYLAGKTTDVILNNVSSKLDELIGDFNKNLNNKTIYGVLRTARNFVSSCLSSKSDIGFDSVQIEHRKATRYIAKMLKDGDLIEDCNPQ